MTVKSNYIGKVYIVYAVTFADLILNGIADHSAMPGGPQWMPLIWIGVQLFIQLLNLTMFAMMLFDTYLFQVGLIGVLMREFRGLIGLGVYALLFGSYAAVKVSLVLGQGMSEDAMWKDGLFVAFSIIQKLGALGYYVLLLHYTSKLGQPQWYQKHHWVAKYSAEARGAFHEGMTSRQGPR